MGSFREQPPVSDQGNNGLQPGSGRAPEGVNRVRRGLLIAGVATGAAGLVDHFTGGHARRAAAEMLFGREAKTGDRLTYFRGLVDQYTTAGNAVDAAIAKGDAGTMIHPIEGSYVFDFTGPETTGSEPTSYDFTVLRKPADRGITRPTLRITEWTTTPPVGEAKVRIETYLGAYGIETRDFDDDTPHTLSEDEMKRRVTNFLKPELGKVDWIADPSAADLPKNAKHLKGFIRNPEAHETFQVEINYNGRLSLELYDGIRGQQ